MSPPLRVLDASSGSLAASAASGLLAACGVTVWKVERGRDGDPLRAVAGAHGGPLAGRPHAWTGRGKRWIGVTAAAAGWDVLDELASASDVVLVSERDGWERLAGRSGTVCVTPFGVTGPRSDWRASGFGLFHAAGPGFVTPRAPAEGLTELVPPQAPWGHVAEHFGAVFAAIAVLGCARSDTPERVDLSLQECLLPLMRRETGAWQFQGYLASRAERLWRVAPSGFYPTADGHVYASVIENRQWQALCGIMERQDLAEDERFVTAESRFVHLDEVNEAIGGWFAERSSTKVFQLCGEAGIPVGPALGPHQLLASEQLAARGALEHGAGGDAWPGLPMRQAGEPPTPWPKWDEPAPGRDTNAVLAEVGWTEDRIRAARDEGKVF
ncbi:MAG TPA: CoA transferase [Solirubrobacteraceae bacterium]|nr:CoA transferase [Solirubrobacteraceae bacterium]